MRYKYFQCYPLLTFESAPLVHLYDDTGMMQALIRQGRQQTSSEELWGGDRHSFPPIFVFLCPFALTFAQSDWYLRKLGVSAGYCTNKQLSSLPIRLSQVHCKSPPIQASSPLCLRNILARTLPSFRESQVSASDPSHPIMHRPMSNAHTLTSRFSFHLPNLNLILLQEYRLQYEKCQGWKSKWVSEPCSPIYTRLRVAVLP